MEESTVLYEYDEDLTVNSRTAGAHRKRRHVSKAYYIFLSHDFEAEQAEAKRDGVINPQNYNFNQF